MQDFDAARLAGVAHLQNRDGIGTLAERSLHATLKYWFEPDEQYHEVKLPCGVVADICDGHRVVEIQTRRLASLRSKLEKLLPDWPVTVVHPMAWHKTLVWVDPDTGESTKPRRSPKVGQPWDALGELYWLYEFIGHPNLMVVLLLLDMEEYRLRDGWSRDGKKGSHRTERIPTAVGEPLVLADRRDYVQLLPPGLPDDFTTADFARCGRLTARQSGYAVNTLYKIGTISRIGKSGRAHLYRVQNEGADS